VISEYAVPKPGNAYVALPGFFVYSSVSLWIIRPASHITLPLAVPDGIKKYIPALLAMAPGTSGALLASLYKPGNKQDDKYTVDCGNQAEEGIPNSGILCQRACDQNERHTADTGVDVRHLGLFA